MASRVRIGATTLTAGIVDMSSLRQAGSLQALTNIQLRQYRRELERSLRGIAEGAPVRELIQRKLIAVVAEQEARTAA